MSKFTMGSMMGFMLGAGMMMGPMGRELQRDARHAMAKARRWMKNM